jgi:probable HAF family extracellular repeat protein
MLGAAEAQMFAQGSAADSHRQRAPKDLGTLGGTQSQAASIDSEWNIVGSSNLTGDLAAHAFLSPEGERLKDLGVLSGGTNSTGVGSSDEGERVAGTSEYLDPINGLVSHPFLYAKGVMTDLGTLGGAIAQATGIGGGGRVVGLSLLSDGATTHAFLYNAKTSLMTDLGTLPNPTIVNSQALGISSLGLFVAGTSDTANSDTAGNTITDAVVWNHKNVITDLGNLGGSLAQANAVNDWGVAVGVGVNASGNYDAFVSKVGGGLIDIGTLGGSASSAQAINDWGVVVGYSNTTTDADVHAFVWTAAKGMVDLNSFLPANSPWNLTAAYGINSRNTIVGVGTINGEGHAFAFTIKP